MRAQTKDEPRVREEGGDEDQAQIGLCRRKEKGLGHDDEQHGQMLDDQANGPSKYAMFYMSFIYPVPNTSMTTGK